MAKKIKPIKKRKMSPKVKKTAPKSTAVVDDLNIETDSDKNEEITFVDHNLEELEKEVEKAEEVKEELPTEPEKKEETAKKKKITKVEAKAEKKVEKTEDTAAVEKTEDTTTNSQFDIENLKKNGYEVWTKKQIIESHIIVNPDGKSYQTWNTYNGVVGSKTKKTMEFEFKSDVDKMKKLEKKQKEGYKKQ